MGATTVWCTLLRRMINRVKIGFDNDSNYVTINGVATNKRRYNY